MKNEIEKAFRLFIEKIGPSMSEDMFVIVNDEKPRKIQLIARVGRMYGWTDAESFLFGNARDMSVFVVAEKLLCRPDTPDVRKGCIEILKYAGCSSAEELTLKLEIAE